MIHSAPDFLRSVLENKKKEVEKLNAIGMRRLEALADSAGKPLDFLGRLRRQGSVPIVAEIKRSAPSWNGYSKNLGIESVAKAYQNNGAAAISVLTDYSFFGGSLDDLSAVRRQVTIPVLRKDFMISVEQIYEARAAHADAVLLILAILDDHEVANLYKTALSLGMTPLLEVHDEHETKRALRLEPSLIGINNRNLKTLAVNLEVSKQLRKMIPRDTTVVAESGVTSVDDIQRLLCAGIDAFLIGTALVKSEDPGGTLASFVNVRRM